MSDSEILFIIFVCLCGGYLLGRAHAFVINILNDCYNENSLSEIENHLKVIDNEIATIIGRVEKKS
ncbi:MAG: hypothetical protein ACTTI6_07395 [Treponema sp.]|uniref:hypothetical protein n=1 Tax=Treponema sp. TaxID=166 RepID=UPI003FA32D8B